MTGRKLRNPPEPMKRVSLRRRQEVTMAAAGNASSELNLFLGLHSLKKHEKTIIVLSSNILIQERSPYIS